MSSIIRATTTSGLQVAPDNSGNLELQTNGTTTAVTIDTSQNVGIGTTSPSSILNVSAASPTILLTATTTTGTTIGNKNNRLLLASNSGTVNNGGEIVFAATDTNVDRWAAISGAIQSNSVSGCYGDILFATKATDAATTLTERMRIDSSGNVLINTTSVVNSSRLSVVEDLTSLNGIGIKNTGSTYGGSTDFIVFMNNVDAAAGRVSQTAVTTVAYTTSSDYRLKENIVPMTGALNKVLQLKPVSYRWKQDGSNGQGFIAHELQEIVPDCVVGEKDAVDAEGNPKYQGIDTSFLVATLVAAIQEQQTIINDLKTRIETLEAK